MQKRLEQTRQVLVRATAEIIANGRVADAGLVNICRTAGVSRGALYHHFASIAELVAEVHAGARVRIRALARDAFAAAPPEAPARFSIALGAALSGDELVRAGMQLGAGGTDVPPRLREETFGMVRERILEDAPRDVDLEGLADLAVAVTAGLESLGHADARWWDPQTSERIWGELLPLFAAARRAPDQS